MNDKIFASALVCFFLLPEQSFLRCKRQISFLAIRTFSTPYRNCFVPSISSGLLRCPHPCLSRSWLPLPSPIHFLCHFRRTTRPQNPVLLIFASILRTRRLAKRPRPLLLAACHWRIPSVYGHYAYLRPGDPDGYSGLFERTLVSAIYPLGIRTSRME
jgi:hypothetical protein